MKILKKITAVFIVLVFAFMSMGMMETDNYTYWLSNAETFTVHWDASISPNIVQYHVIMQWIVGTEVRQEYDIGYTPGLEMELTAPRIGSFIVGIKAIDDVGLESEYSFSNDSELATVNDNQRAWMVIFYMSSPGPIIIGKENFENNTNEETV